MDKRPFLQTLRQFGPAGALDYVGYKFAARTGQLRAGGASRTIRSPESQFPLHLRPATSDFLVFKQVFVRGEYTCVDLAGCEAAQPLVLDCGANVGYASAFFLSQHPGARVMAVEPEAGNYAAMQTNLAPYGDRVLTRHAAVWTERTTVSIAPPTYRDGAEWSRQIATDAPAAASDVPALPMSDLVDEALGHFGGERLSLVKIDIEGAEGPVFAADDRDWIDRVDQIVIELHEDSSFGPAAEPFFHAIDERGFTHDTHAESVIANRPVAA